MNKNMAVTAKLRYLRIAPRKVRLMADLIKGKKVQDAQNILNFTVRKSAQPLLKLLNSAVASASHNFQMEPTNLYISKVLVNEGPKLKRWRPRARGQAFEIQKKTSHITIVLDEIEKRAKKTKKAEKIKKAKKVVKKLKKKKKEKEEKPGLRPELEVEKPKTTAHPRMGGAPPFRKRAGVQKGGLRRIFRRKAF